MLLTQEAHYYLLCYRILNLKRKAGCYLGVFAVVHTAVNRINGLREDDQELLGENKPALTNYGVKSTATQNAGSK